MKKILLSALLAMATAPVISLAATEVRGGQVSMNGSLLPQTCTVNGNGQGSDFTVNMGDVSMSELIGKQTLTVIRAVTNSIQIKLTGCSAGGAIPGANGAVRARFDGPNYQNYLANSGTGRGVLVGLLNADGSDIPIGAPDRSAGTPYVTITGGMDNGTATLVYGHKYVKSFATDAQVVPGPVRASVQYTIEYE